MLPFNTDKGGKDETIEVYVDSSHFKSMLRRKFIFSAGLHTFIYSVTSAMASQKLVWLITGANSGFGLRLAQLALKEGHIVVATARDLSKFPAALRDQPNADLIGIEITASALAITKTVDSIISKYGHLDVLVNNAGFAHVGSVEETSDEEARYQFDVNFFGLVNFSKAAIAHMRAQGAGIILQMSSGAGISGNYGSSFYAASKFAVEGFTESLASEVVYYGIRVHLIEPGAFRTNLLKPSTEGRNVSQKKDGYPDIAAAVAAQHGKQPGDPEKAAQRLYEVVTGVGAGAGLEKQLRILLGSDSLTIVQAKIQAFKEAVEKTEKLAVSTDYQTEPE